MKSLSNYNIMIIGDSISKGLYLDGSNIKKVSDSAINIIENRYNIKLFNDSCYGQTLSRASSKGLFDKAIQHKQPDKNNIVVIALGGNDADYNWKEVALSPTKNHQPKTPMDQYESLLIQNIKFLQKNNIKVIICSIFPIDSKRYFDNVISSLADKHQIIQFLDNDISNISRQQECFNSALKKAVNETMCDFIDYRSKLMMKNDFLSFLCDDGVHPNQKGHKFIAEVVMDYIENKNKKQ